MRGIMSINWRTGVECKGLLKQDLEHMRQTTTTRISGKVYNLILPDAHHLKQDGSVFRIDVQDEDGNDAGCLAFILATGVSESWHKNAGDYYSHGSAIVIVRAIIRQLFPLQDLPISSDSLTQARTAGKCIRVVLEKGDPGQMQYDSNELKVTIGSAKTPRDFIAATVYGGNLTDSKLRLQVLKQLNENERVQPPPRYELETLETDLVVDSAAFARAIDYLAQKGLIILEPHLRDNGRGDTESFTTVRIAAPGTDLLESASEDNTTTDVHLNPKIQAALSALDPKLGTAYGQVAHDLNDTSRSSWQGAAGEVRELLRHSLEELAPNDKVMAQDGFVLETDQAKPTRKQKVMYILTKRQISGDAGKQVKGSVERIGGVGAAIYSRGSQATHNQGTRDEAVKLFAYFNAICSDLFL
jgi:hypothetical protein